MEKRRKKKNFQWDVFFFPQSLDAHQRGNPGCESLPLVPLGKLYTAKGDWKWISGSFWYWAYFYAILVQFFIVFRLLVANTTSCRLGYPATGPERLKNFVPLP